MPKSNTLLWVNELNGGYYLECPPLEIYASGEDFAEFIVDVKRALNDRVDELAEETQKIILGQAPGAEVTQLREIQNTTRTKIAAMAETGNDGVSM